MKVIVSTMSGIKKEALLDKDSGVIEYPGGEITHILYEKQLGKIISIQKDAPRAPKEEPSSEEQSKPSKKVKTKAQ